MRPLVARLGVLALIAAVACQAAQAPGPSAGPGTSAVAVSASASPAPSPTVSYPVREGTCAMRVSESFTLANDLTCAGDGMVIVSDNVTVDLGGHTLTGPGMGPQTWPLPQLDSVGVRVGGHTGVTIRNGKTTAFSTGIYFIDMVSSSIESVTTLRNRFGFYIHASQKITVKDSDVEFNIYGLHLQNSDDCVLVNNLLARQTYNSPGGYEPAAARPPRGVTIVALVGGAVQSMRPGDIRASAMLAADSKNVRQIALGTDERTVYSSVDRVVVAQDVVTGETKTKQGVTVDGVVAANRDGHSVMVVGKTGAEQIDLTTGQAEYFDYHGSAESLAPSYKHNHVFVATENGIDLLYLNLGGRTPYTIPLDGEPTAMVMAGSGTRIYAAIAGRRLVDVVDTEQYAVVDRIVTDVFPTSLAISPREDTLYVGSANGAEAVTIRDRSVVSSAAFLGSVVDLAVSPNGDQLYVALAGLSHAIAVLDAPHLRVAHVIELDNDPSRILVASY